MVLIVGNEDVLAQRALRGELSVREGYEQERIDAREASAGRFLESIAPSLFSQKRLLIVSEVQDAAPDFGEEILRGLTLVDPGLELIFLHRGGVKGKSILEGIKKFNPKVITCDPIKKISEKEAFIRQEFEALNRKITSGGVTALLQALGSDMQELAAACSQIAFDTNAAKALIDEGDIDKYHQGRIERSGFDVADATLAGDPKGALICLRSALDTGTDPVMIVAALASALRSLAKVSGVARQSKSFEVAGSLGMAPWQIDKARRQLSHFSPDLLAFSIKELAKADIAVKGGQEPRYAVERVVLQIASRVKSPV
jgi:DNA polymerase-3 subunit delta